MTVSPAGLTSTITQEILPVYSAQQPSQTAHHVIPPFATHASPPTRSSSTTAFYTALLNAQTALSIPPILLLLFA